MGKQIRKVRPILHEGAEVTVMNCVDTGRVVKRLGVNRYLVEYQGTQIEMPRSNIELVSAEVMRARDSMGRT